MLSFESDYNNGAHPLVLQHLINTNCEITLTYGFDEYSENAKRKIKEVCEAPDADVFFLIGGTQTNATVIDGMLQSYEAVVTVETGHINVHEATAIEASGHKVIALKAHNGKMDAKELEHFMNVLEHDESRWHCAQPGLVYVTLPTELGTIYSMAELGSIYDVCLRHGLLLYVDGARLGYGLTCDGNDITLPWLTKHCDAFYIGGTKVGALCGEAVVFTHANAPKAFFNIIKRHGALLAKGRLAGVQFDALFTDNLYFRIARHANEMAARLRTLFVKKNYRFFISSPTNQQFVILPNNDVEHLSQHVEFTHWGPYDDNHTICRFVTSWSTKEEDVEALSRLL